MTDNYNESFLRNQLAYARKMVFVGTFIGSSVGMIAGAFWENKTHAFSKKSETETVKPDTGKHFKSVKQFVLDGFNFK